MQNDQALQRNDPSLPLGQDAGHSYRDCVRGLEGLIRHARAAQPELDIVVRHTPSWPNMITPAHVAAGLFQGCSIIVSPGCWGRGCFCSWAFVCEPPVTTMADIFTGWVSKGAHAHMLLYLKVLCWCGSIILCPPASCGQNGTHSDAWLPSPASFGARTFPLRASAVVTEAVVVRR